MRDLIGPFWLGFANGIGVVLGIALGLLFLVGEQTHPSAQLFRDLAALGAGLFIAFSVAIATSAGRPSGELRDHLSWLGISCGFGCSALAAIGISIGLAAYRQAGHESAWDIVGLYWIVSALFFVGVLVAFLPYATYSWQRSDGDED